MTRVGVDDEGTYACTLSNSLGSATFSSTLLVDCKYRNQHPGQTGFSKVVTENSNVKEAGIIW